VHQLPDRRRQPAQARGALALRTVGFFARPGGRRVLGRPRARRRRWRFGIPAGLVPRTRPLVPRRVPVAPARLLSVTATTRLIAIRPAASAATVGITVRAGSVAEPVVRAVISAFARFSPILPVAALVLTSAILVVGAIHGIIQLIIQVAAGLAVVWAVVVEGDARLVDLGELVPLPAQGIGPILKAVPALTVARVAAEPPPAHAIIRRFVPAALAAAASTARHASATRCSTVAGSAAASAAATAG
jgi:hypothetical protein